jgi:hypothetical protein
MLALALFGGAAHAQQPPGPPGRYQAIPLDKPNDPGNSVLVIDTATGDIWKWSEGTVSGGKAATVLTYEGAVVAGDKPGEPIARWGLGVTAMQRPRSNPQ